MKLTERSIFIISADPAVTQGCINELALFGKRYQFPVACSIKQACQAFRRITPSVIFLDESAVLSGGNQESLEAAVALLTEASPVVVAASPQREAGLAFLIALGAVDFVPRTDQFLSVAARLLEGRMCVAERAAGTIPFPDQELAWDFGEILRHEVNNPLTGILGNTELLLARRAVLPPGAVERLQTIAELTVRLRETVRRLSNAWEQNREPVRRA